MSNTYLIDSAVRDNTPISYLIYNVCKV